MRAAWAQAREAWLLPLALPVGPASVPRPASAAGAGAGVLPRWADYLFSDQTGPSEQAAVVEAEVGGRRSGSRGLWGGRRGRWWCRRWGRRCY